MYNSVGGIFMIIQTDNFGHSKAFKAERCEGEYHYPMHLHQYAQIVYVYSGTLELQTWEHTERVNAGSFAVIMPFQAHKLDTLEPSSLLICVFSERLISDFTGENTLLRGENCVFLPESEMKDYALKQLDFKNSFLACDYNDEPQLRKVKSGIYAVCEEYFAKTKIVSRTSGNDLLTKIILYVYNNPAQDISLPKMAEEFGYHPNSVSHCFKSAIGMNYCSFVNCVRAERAKILLLSTDLTAEQIGAVCGYPSKRTFHRCFKTTTGMTPLDYRRKAAVHNDGDFKKDSEDLC